MKRLGVGASITGTVFSVLQALYELIGLFALLTVQRGAAAPVIETIVLNLVDIILMVLMTVVLLRRRKDIFAGVVFCLSGLYLCANGIASLVGMPEYSLLMVFISGCRVLTGLLLIMMAVDCFADFSFRFSVKRLIYGGGIIVLAVAWIVLYSFYLTSFYRGLGMTSVSYAITSFFSIFIGSVSMYAAYACAGFAVANARDTEKANLRPAQESSQNWNYPAQQAAPRQEIDWYGYQNKN